MANAGQQVARCAYPGCENEPRPGSAEPVTAVPDPMTASRALTAVRQRQVLAGQGGRRLGLRTGRPEFASGSVR